MSTTTRDAPPGATDEDRRYLDRHRDHLSPTTLRAKWTHEPGEPPDRDGQTLATRSRAVIRDWAERRGAKPAAATRGDDGRPRTLRFVFGRDGGRAAKADAGEGRRRSLETVGWEDWLAVFEERDLVFLYQERRRDGSDSNFFRLDSPQREDG